MASFFPDKKDSHSEDDNRSWSKIDKVHFIRRCQLFSSLSDWEVRSIAKLARLVEIKRDEVVSRAGEEGKSFYVVVSGRFAVYRSDGETQQVIAYFKQGSHFGEMSLVSKEPHSATVQARSDSLVLEISKEHFEHIVKNNASVSLEISRILSTRLKARNLEVSKEQNQHIRSDVVAIKSLHKEPEQATFSINLAASLQHETDQKVVLVDMSASGHEIPDKLHVSSELPREYFKDLGQDLDLILKEHTVLHDSGIQLLNLANKYPGIYTSDFITHLINRLAVDYRYILIHLPEQMDESVSKVITHSDFIFLVTDNSMSTISEVQEIIHDLDRSLTSSDEKVKVAMVESVLGYAPTYVTRHELFGKKDCFYLPGVSTDDNSSEILILSKPESNYALTVRRIARKISNNLIGLALGSGAALGYSHIGVLKVLEQEKIPIDYISGSSMGAMIASFYATGSTIEEMEELSQKLTAWQLILLAILDLSFIPWKGLLSGKYISRYLGKYLRGATFENAKIPLLIVGANIHRRTTEVLDSGPILEALRASIAIPGIFHPVKWNNEIIIDGGVLDPLPIQPLIDVGVDKIIAVDVLPTPDDVREKRRFKARVQKTHEHMVAKKNIVKRSAFQVKKKARVMMMPNLIDVVVNSMQAMEHEIADASSSSADVLIRPHMPHIGWMEFHRAKELIEKGETAAYLQIEELRNLVKQQTL